MTIFLVAVIGLVAGSVQATEATRYFPDDLQQDGRATLSPTFSADGSTIVFPQSACVNFGRCPQRLHRARRTADGGWTAPEPLEQVAGVRADWPAFTPDGESVIVSLSMSRARHEGEDVVSDFDLYRLELAPGAAPVPLDEPGINRIRGGEVRTLRYVHNEAPGGLAADGSLYFFTERLDEGFGERDIYRAAPDGEGGFLPPEPLAPPIGSPAREETPWLLPEGDTMLLTISAPDNLNDGDVFVARRTEDGWSAPTPLGVAVNTPYNEYGARITPDGETLVFTSDRPLEPGGGRVLQVWSVPIDAVAALDFLRGDAD